MQAKVKLIFLGVAEFNKKDGDKFEVPVFYDEDSAKLVKPYYNDSDIDKLKALKQFDMVLCVLEIFETKNGGMGTKIINLITETQAQKQAS